MQDSEIDNREKKVLSFIQEKKRYLIYISVAIIIYFGSFIRIQNLSLAKDATTGQYIPIELDSFLFLRQAEDILKSGSLAAIDFMRNYPLGFPNASEVPLLSHFIVLLYKFVHLFNPAVTLAYIDVIYPVVCFAIGAVFFFLLVKTLFDNRVALLSLLLLVVIPPYLQRTIVGFSDKEALAMMFMFMVFYFYVLSIKEKDFKICMLYALLAGISTGLLGLCWGGITFVFLIVGCFELVRLFLNKFSNKSFYAYCIWFFSFVPILLIFGGDRFTATSLVLSLTSGITVLVLGIGLVNLLVFKMDLFKMKNKIISKMPRGIFSFGIVLIFGLLFMTLFIEHTYVYSKINDIIFDMTTPLTDRWALTVAESHEPYITDWFGQMGTWYIWLFLFGTILLFYECIKNVKKYALKATFFFGAFLIAFVFSRYSASASVLNGTSPLSVFMYVGGLAIFIAASAIFYLYVFYKDKECFEIMHKIKKEYLFMIIVMIIMIMAGRRAIRLVLIMAPFTTILFSFLMFRIADYSSNLKEKVYKYLIWAVLAAVVIIIVFNPISSGGYYQTTMGQAKSMGPSYNQQWQVAGKWVRENTPENAVFAHWWDYGYWVQSGFRRASITDGGNAIGYWNYLMGRHVLTGKSDKEALDFLYAHDANYVLMITDEVGKYPAFSSIGSNETYDRYSWINTFTLDLQNTQETRNGIRYLYRGGFVLDDDLIYQGKLYPKGQAGIGAVLISVVNVDNSTENQTNSFQTIEKPTVAMIYNGQQTEIPLNCIFIDNKLIEYPGDGIDGCFRVLPTIENNNQMNPIGAGLYLSEKVKDTRFAEWYLYGKSSKNFELVYSDEAQMPLAVYQGMLIGPLKIWKVSYPEGMQKDQIYLQKSFPNPAVYKI